ncbi:unnamed protein product [Auanema sp. JU1783]|nr:unnamed protein product [Auanema sp. JU1783]
MGIHVCVSLAWRRGYRKFEIVLSTLRYFQASALLSLMTSVPVSNTEGEDGLIQCYNKGCGQKFDPFGNGEDTTPDPPTSTMLIKSGTAVTRKVLTSVAAVKEIRPEKEEDVIVWKGLNKPAERIAEHERVEKQLEVEVSASAVQALQRYKEQNASTLGSQVLKVGAPCRHMSCTQKYSGNDSDLNQCVYHPGEAIFHEGMKYWSCCQKKTSNFGAFLEQKGCETGEHVWSMEEKVEKIKEDWFSSAGVVTVNIYSKGTIPEESSISSDGQVLRVHLKHGFGLKETDLLYELWGRVNVENSKAIIGERKVEIKLKQEGVAGWPRLRYDPAIDSVNTAA